MTEIIIEPSNPITIEVNYEWILSELENRCVVPEEVKKALRDIEKQGKQWVIE